MACTIILYSRLLRGSNQFTTWSASQQPGQQFVEKPKAGKGGRPETPIS